MSSSSGGPVKLIDNPLAPEIFCTGSVGTFFLNGNIVLTLQSTVSDYSVQPPVMSNKVIGRLVMPLASAQALALDLNAYLEQHDMSPTKAFKGGATEQ